MHISTLFFEKKYSAVVERFIIFISALIVRFPLIFIFFGSADMRNEIPITKLIFAHTQSGLHLPYPYVPLAAMFSWAAGVLNIYTSFPLSFCYKIIPIFFDLLLAVLVYDIFKRSKPDLAFKAGLLYAFAPIPLIINCIHFQWDSIVLFFLVLSFYVRDYFNDSLLKYFLFGLLFALSFLFKPYTLAFVFFFFTPFQGFAQKLGHSWCIVKVIALLTTLASIALYVICRMTRFSFEKSLLLNASVMQGCIVGLMILCILFCILCVRLYVSASQDLKTYFHYQSMSLLGMSITVIAALTVLHFLGFNVLAGIDHLLRYANKGTPQFGLPFAYPFVMQPFRLWLENRMWLLMVTAFISYFYYHDQLDSFTGILLSFLAIIGLSGLYAPYLQWPFVFFLLTGFFKAGSLYNILVSIFLLLFYCNPYSNYAFPYESMLSFAALKSCAWLMPPHFLSDYSFIPLLAMISNYLIPFFSLGTVVYGLQASACKASLFLSRRRKNISLINNGYLLANISLFLSIVIAWKFVDTNGFDRVLNEIAAQKMLWYHTYCLAPFGNMTIAFFPDWSWFNIVFIMAFVSGIWSVCIWRLKRSKNTRSSE